MSREPARNLSELSWTRDTEGLDKVSPNPCLPGTLYAHVGEAHMVVRKTKEVMRANLTWNVLSTAHNDCQRVEGSLLRCFLKLLAEHKAIKTYWKSTESQAAIAL